MCFYINAQVEYAEKIAVGKVIKFVAWGYGGRFHYMSSKWLRVTAP